MIKLFLKILILIYSIFLFSVNKITANYILPDSLFVNFDGGSFIRGSNKGDKDEMPDKKIFISEFLISKFEITNSQYCKFLNSVKLKQDDLIKYIELNNEKCRIIQKDSFFKVKEGFENYPVNFVSWFGANAFCNFYNYRLPTEAEWEYAAKGGRSNIAKLLFKNYYNYSGSNEADKVAWYENNSENNVNNIGIKQANKKGIFDMSGNVDEWCSDWYSVNYYNVKETKNPEGPKNGDFKVYRGGSWYNSEKFIRISNRRAANPKSQKETIGFRVVKDVAVFCPVKFEI